MPNSTRADASGRSSAFRDADLVAVVAVGGVIGSLARATLDVVVGHLVVSRWPWPTFGVNAAGSLCLGFVLVWLMHRAPRGARIDRWLKPFVVTGILGGFTTFSAYSMQVRDLLAAGDSLMGVGYALVSIAVGVAAVVAGAALARARWSGQPSVGES